jgi:uncharacterized protein (DUF1697 family)
VPATRLDRLVDCPHDEHAGIFLGMQVVIALLRGVNVGGHHQIKMEVLRALCESLGLCNPQTYVQSGNVVFSTKERDLVKLARRIEAAIEMEVGFRPDVILRTTDEIRGVITRNPFTKRKGIEPGKLVVTFLAGEPASSVRQQLLGIKGRAEEVHLHGREMYVYFPDGMGRSKLVPVLARILKNTGTARNWNTVNKLLDMAKKIEM